MCIWYMHIGLGCYLQAVPFCLTWLEPNSLCGFEMEFALSAAKVHKSALKSTKAWQRECPCHRFDWKIRKTSAVQVDRWPKLMPLPKERFKPLFPICSPAPGVVWCGFPFWRSPLVSICFKKFRRGQSPCRRFQTWVSWCLQFLPQGLNGFSVLTWLGQKVEIRKRTPQTK